MSIFTKIFGGTVANDGTGSNLRTGGDYVNENFDKTVARIDSVENIAGLTGDYDGQQISMLGWHSGSDIGGGILYWDSGRAKSDHNGGTVFSPTVPWSIVVGDYLDGVGETDSGGAGVWVRFDSHYVTPDMFGARLLSGIDTVSVVSAILSDYSVGLQREYVLDEDVSLSNLNGKTIFALNSGSGFKLSEGVDLILKSPTDILFRGISIVGTKSDASYQSIHISNYKNVIFDKCRFEGFGGLTENKAGSTIIYAYGLDYSTTTQSPGDSENLRVLNCEFNGDGRFTNFGIRVYSEWDPIQVSTNKYSYIEGCTFRGFNWNAVEVAGVNTSFCSINNCKAVESGLMPFDIDKGAHDCRVSDCSIDRILGNIDTDVNPNTRAICVGHFGWNTDEPDRYGYNNVTENISIRLLKSDLDSFVNETSIIGMVGVFNCVVRNIEAYCDDVPLMIGNKFGLSIFSYQTIAGCKIEQIKCSNASAGIIQVGANNQEMDYTTPNRIISIENSGIMTGELIYQGVDNIGSALSKFIIEDIKLETDLTAPRYITGLFNYGINVKATGSSLNFTRIKNSFFKIPVTAYLALDQIANLSLENIAINGIGTTSNLVHSEGSTSPQALGVNKVVSNVGRNNFDLKDAFSNLHSGCKITSGINDIGFELNTGGFVYTSGQPSAPSASNWSSALKVELLSKTAGGFEGYLNAGGVWKTYGSVSS